VPRGAAFCLLMLVTVACGGGAGRPVPQPAGSGAGRMTSHVRPGEAAILGPLTWHLDQLVPPPGPTPDPPVLLAVLRASTAGPAEHLHTAGISLVDDAGGRWSPVPIPVYVPIDGLEGASVEPAHGAAGVVAFRLPSGRRGVAVVVSGGDDEVILDAPR
jgi:hypothetical protein